MIRRAALLCFGILILQSCNKYDANGNLIREYEELDKAKWILGDWEQKDSMGTLTESWESLDDSTYIGRALYISTNKDTLHNETMAILQNGDFLIYSTVIKGENGDEPTLFQMREDTDSLLVFENPKHNYPKKIIYRRNKDATALITISGTQNGKPSTENYRMQKKK